MACALAAGIAMADGVTSANTVGFQDITTETDGFTSVCPSFVKVGTQTATTLADISGTFIEGESIQFIDTEAATADEYFYCVKGSLVATDTGWYESDFETPAGTTVIPIGASVLYQSLGTDTITFCGEVNESDVVVSAETEGFTAVGNPFPVDTTLSAVAFSGLAEGDSIQFLDSEAGTAEEYFYCVKGSLVTTDTGWYESDFETPAGTTGIGGGVGFLYQNASESPNVTISFTAPTISL